MEPVESLVPNATLEPGLVWSGPRRAIRDRDVAAEASRQKLDKAAEVRLHLQRSAPANLRHHLRRAAIRLGVLIAGDMVAFGAIRALVRAVRDDQLLGGAVAARLHAALPAGVVNGWQYAAALFLGLVVLGKPSTVSTRKCRSPSFGSTPPVSVVSHSTASKCVGISGMATMCGRVEMVACR